MNKLLKNVLFLTMFTLTLGGCGNNPDSGSDTPQDVLPTKIIANPTSIDIYTNTSRNLNDLISVSFEPNNVTNTNYEYSYSENIYFDITNNVIATYNEIGSSTIFVVSSAKKDIKTEVTINVIGKQETDKPATSVSFNSSSINMELSEGNKIVEATVTPIDTTDAATWAVLEGNDIINIAPDNNKVTISPLKEGNATIKVSYNDNAYATLSVTISDSSSTEEDISIKYDIKYDMGTRKTSYQFKEGENDLIKNTFVSEGTSIIKSVSSFTYIYGGGYGGKSETAWYSGDMLKFGTTSVNGELDLELTRPVNKMKVTGFVGDQFCKVQVGDSNSTDWTEDTDDNKTTVVTCSEMATASKEVVESKSFTSFEVEFTSTYNLTIATINRKVLYITAIELFFDEVKTFTVTWKNYDGTVLETDTNVVEGSLPTYDGATPARDGYRFTGWDKEITPIHKDETYIASFALIGEKYVVTWKNYDGTVIEIDNNVEAGTIPTYDSGSPRRNDDEEYKYIFSGWNPIVEEIYEDTIYVATYLKVSKNGTTPGFSPIISSDYKKAEYGFYPQSHVSDEQIISVLNKLNPINSMGWYIYNGEFYIKDTSHVYNNENYTFVDGSSITNETSYWFKCETIKWNVVEVKNGEYTLMSEMLLDTHNYYNSYSERTINEQTIYANNYQYSGVRSYLNDYFYQTAFYLEDKYIKENTILNSGATTDKDDNAYICDNTKDKVFLPSYQDVVKLDNKTALTSDYARCMGAFCNIKDSAYKYNGSYWTRSPSSTFNYAAWNVNSGGVLSEYAVDGNSHCIRPCITISL